MDLASLASPEVDALSRETPILIPIAALEQHGRHMPVVTDSMLVEEIVRRAQEPLRSQILVLPVMWLGPKLDSTRLPPDCVRQWSWRQRRTGAAGHL